MITWVLILIVYSPGVGVTSVPGFQSREECEQAASAVRSNAGAFVSTKCVPQTGRKP